MYSLKIDDGDLQVSADGVPQQVTSVERIKQELAAWLIEPLGTDPLYPGFGSTLKSMVGEGITRDLKDDISEEVSRVVANYIEYQMRLLKEATHSQDKTLAYRIYSPDDIVTELQGVDVLQNMDIVKVVVRVRIAGGTVIQIAQELV